jgi:hypothetical protein
MMDTENLAAATADRDEYELPLDVEAAADAIESLLERRADGSRPGASPGSEDAMSAPGEADGSASAWGNGTAEPRLRVRLGGEEREMSLSELAALYDGLAQGDAPGLQGRGPEVPAGEPASPPHELQAQYLAAVVPALQEQLRPFAGLNWERMAAEDPALYAQARPAFDALSAQLDAAEAAQAHVEEQRAQMAGAAAAAQAERLGAEREALAAKVPEFADPERAPREAAALLGYLGKAGYRPADLAALTDHRHIVVARKAMLYDRLMEGRARVAETLKALPRVQLPGAAPERGERGLERRGPLMQRLRRSGRIEDAARLIEHMI